MVSRSRSTLSAKLRIGVLALTVPVAAAAAALVSGPTRAHAEGAEADQAEANERCALRLSIALLGKSPDTAAMSAKDPQANVDAMVRAAEFSDRYARFVNAEFNGAPITSATDDPIYWLARYVVQNDKPWRDLFVGKYSVLPTPTGMEVKDDPAGIGYFNTPSWKVRYAGNEPAGMMLVAAFRTVQNTTGIDLLPSVGSPDDDRTATGRATGVCKSCHFDAWYALDTYAELFPRKTPNSDPPEIKDLPVKPQKIMGKMVSDRRQLTEALVDSEGFKFNQCRLVFKFLYGRAENQCEAPVFDKCVDALTTTKTLRSAVAAVAKDSSFCK